MKMPVIECIKKEFIKHPFITSWKVLMFPFAVTSALLFAAMLVIFNLSFDEAKEFLSEAFLIGG